MNKFAIGALALTTASSLAYAGGTETKEWSTFDRDISSLISSQGPTAAGLIELHGFVRARGAWSQEVDVDTGTAGDQDLGGFHLDNARGEVSISQGDYGGLITFDVEQSGPGSTSLQVLDAFGTFKIVEGITGQVGRFKPPFLWSSFLVNDNNLLMLDRTFNGQLWQGRQDGVQIGGMFDLGGGGQSIGWWAAMQNGGDGPENEYLWTGRVQLNLLGTGLGNQEGALPSMESSSLNVMVGAAYANDQGVDAPGEDEGGMWALDAAIAQGAFSLHLEVADYEDHVRPDSMLNTSTGVINAAFGGTTETPWSGTASYLLTQQAEIGIRFENLDDDDDTIVWTLALNYYVAGHNAKWTAQVSRAESDDDSKEADTGAIGLTVGA